MQKYLLSVVVCVISFSFSVAFCSSLTASERIHNPISSKETITEAECEISDAAQEAISRAWDIEEKTREITELLMQAEDVVKPPECDSVAAKILADKAMQLAEETASQSQTTSSKFKDTAFGLTIITTVGLTATECLPCGTSATTTAEEERISDSAYLRLQQYRFVELAKDSLVMDMARGEGEYLAAMAYLQGCPTEVHGRYAEVTQYKFDRILPKSETNFVALLRNLEEQIANDSILAVECTYFS